MILFRILPEIHKSNLAYPCLSFVLPQGPSLINVTGGGKKRKKEKRETRTAIRRERGGVAERERKFSVTIWRTRPYTVLVFLYNLRF